MEIDNDCLKATCVLAFPATVLDGDEWLPAHRLVVVCGLEGPCPHDPGDDPCPTL